MKLMGALLIFAGAGYGYLSYRRSTMLVLQLAKVLADDLAVLRCQICIHRRTLPAILSNDLGQGLASRYFWQPLTAFLERSDGTVRDCWEQASAALPQPLIACIAPLGALLPAGGETLACAIDEVREELLTLSAEQRAQRAVKLRLAAAMCFSSAALFILVCI